MSEEPINPCVERAIRMTYTMEEEQLNKLCYEGVLLDLFSKSQLKQIIGHFYWVDKLEQDKIDKELNYGKLF